MKQLCWQIMSRSIKRYLGKLVACAIVPVLLVSSVTAQAILIHDHHGHETHGHMLATHDLDEWRENSEHQHEEHEHDDRPADPSGDEDQSIVVEFELPVALPGPRVVSAGVVVSNTVPTKTLVAFNGAAASNGRPRFEGQTSCAHFRRARSTVADILQANHALLL